MSLVTFDHADIGGLAIEAEKARRARFAAKKARTAAIRAFVEEHGEDATFDPDGDKYRSPEFQAATGEEHRAVEAAGKAAAVATRRLRRAIARVIA